MILENVHGTSDLKKLNEKQLETLCDELRTFLVDSVFRTGGHLASNLGVVELTVALHYVFDETDQILWDVGHQSYVHKILTGRKDKFDMLRQKGGISGFSNPDESPRDPFFTGHSGTVVSSAVGLAAARDLQGEDYRIVGVIGDGSLTNGLTYEGLNNVSGRNMLLILNDNEMSISRNVGSVTRNLSKLRVGRRYLGFKRGIKRFIGKIPLLGKPLLKFGRWIKRSLKFLFLNNLFFENFDLKYVGPIDGHNLKDLISVFRQVKKGIDKPVLLHILTKKGKGFAEAERAPQLYHGISNEPAEKATYSDAAGKTLCELAAENEKIVAITAAMSLSTGLSEFSNRFPERFFDVGIAEAHAVTFAGGLAKGGLLPFFAVYSTFLQRAYDSVLHDLCLQNAHAVLLLDRAGFVGGDGKTHQGLFDLSYLSSLPNLKIYTPCSEQELQAQMRAAVAETGVVCIRYPKGADVCAVPVSPCGWQELRSGKDGSIFAVGNRMTAEALQAAQRLEQKGLSLRVVAVNCIKPLDEKSLNAATGAIFTMEENVQNGGFGSAVSLYFAPCGRQVVPFAVPDRFIKCMSVAEQIRDCGLDGESVAAKIEQTLRPNGV